MTDKKIKILTLSDMPLSPSGVATQTKYVIEALLKSGKFQVRSFGGAMKHPNYNPIKTEEWGDDWLIWPVDGYGSQEQLRSIVREEKPDILWFMTDPRFWGWLWEMENEIRPLMPMVYYHVWDNYPYPTFNKRFYESNDFVATISKVTDDIVKTVAPTVKSQYIPHAVDSDVFNIIDDKEQIETIKKNLLKEHYDANKFIFFWNNRNARRKLSGSVIFWFKELLERIGHDKANLIMHTATNDPHGQDLQAIISEIGLTNGEVLFSQQKVEANKLALLYNVADCTINLSDAEGFGLATLESLSCGTPIIINKTGGLQEQIGPVDNEFGIGLEPVSKAIIGSQEIPWIYEDRVSGKEAVDAMEKMVLMSKKERDKLGKAGREHVLKNYNFANFNKTWVDTLVNLHEEEGSWETRNYNNSWNLEEITL